MPPNKSKSYYAVSKGYIDEPTIFSSWGATHPRVTGCDSTYEGFDTLDEAREHLISLGVSEHKEVIKNGAAAKSSPRGKSAFYAVAFGKQPGIYKFWKGNGAESAVKGIPHACYKGFQTRPEAEDFISDWQESFADVCKRRVRDLLGEGYRPKDMKFDLTVGLFEPENDSAQDDLDISSLRISNGGR